jgi:hypothetical protein
MNVKYTVSLRAPFTSNWSKAPHPSLAKALDSAWRKYKRDYSVATISYEGMTIFTNEELMQAFDRMDNLAREQSKPQPLEFAGQVIQEMGKQANTEEELLTAHKGKGKG